MSINSNNRKGKNEMEQSIIETQNIFLWTRKGHKRCIKFDMNY